MAIGTYFRSFFLPGSFQTEELTSVSAWLIRLRWVAVSGIFLFATCLSLFGPHLLPIRMLYRICLLIVFYNFVFFISFRNKTRSSGKGIKPFFLHLQVFLDWIALVSIILLTGGVFSPLITFFVLHIIINSMIFPPRQCCINTVLSLTVLGAVFFLTKNTLYVPEITSWIGISISNLNYKTIIFIFTIYGFILLAATFLATSIMARFRQRETDIRLLSQQLQESLVRMEILYEATKAMVSNPDINSIFNIIVMETAKVMRAKGSVLRLTQQADDELVTCAHFGLSDTYLKKGPVKKNTGIFPKKPDDILIVDDVSSDPRIVYSGEGIKEGIKSIISVPLVYRDEIIGDIRIYFGEPRQFDLAEISFLRIFASGAASMIVSARTWEALEEKNKENIFLAHKLSHDLRAPVVSVQSLLSTMAEGYAGDISESQIEILNRCIKKLKQLAALIKNILNLAESQGPHHDQSLVEVNLDELANDTIQLMQVLFKQKKIAVRYTPPPEPIYFMEVPGDFQRIFSNLLENALQYTPVGEKVEMSVHEEKHNILITVKDSGIGIEPDKLEEIFREFYRSKRAREFVNDGTGLGLSTVKNIVKRYNGFIHVESTPGQETSFLISLPKRTRDQTS